MPRKYKMYRMPVILSQLVNFRFESSDSEYAPSPSGSGGSEPELGPTYSPSTQPQSSPSVSR